MGTAQERAVGKPVNDENCCRGIEAGKILAGLAAEKPREERLFLITHPYASALAMRSSALCKFSIDVANEIRK